MVQLLPLLITLSNVFRTLPTAATAASGLTAGTAMLLDHSPVTTLDWVVLTAGAIGMIANVIHANLSQRIVSDSSLPLTTGGK